MNMSATSVGKVVRDEEERRNPRLREYREAAQVRRALDQLPGDLRQEILDRFREPDPLRDAVVEIAPRRAEVSLDDATIGKIADAVAHRLISAAATLAVLAAGHEQERVT